MLWFGLRATRYGYGDDGAERVNDLIFGIHGGPTSRPRVASSCWGWCCSLCCTYGQVHTAFGFMLKGAQLRLFVIDGVKNRPSKVAGLRLTLVVNGSPSEVGGKQVSIACTFKGRSKMTTWGSVACVQTIRWRWMFFIFFPASNHELSFKLFWI